MSLPSLLVYFSLYRVHSVRSLYNARAACHPLQPVTDQFDHNQRVRAVVLDVLHERSTFVVTLQTGQGLC